MLTIIIQLLDNKNELPVTHYNLQSASTYPLGHLSFKMPYGTFYSVNQEFGQGTVGIAYLSFSVSKPAAGDNLKAELNQLRLQIPCHGGFFAEIWLAP